MKRIPTFKITRTYRIEGEPENISERMLWVRHDAGMTQAENADLIKTSRSNLANKDAGKASWTLEQLEICRVAFDLNMNWVFSGEGRPYRNAKKKAA